MAYSGSVQVTSPAAGTIIYGISCNGGTAQTQVTYTPPTGTLPNGTSPVVQLSSSASTQVVGQSVTLTWSSQHASSCTGSGGESGDGWAGSLPLTGAMHITEGDPGSQTYDIECIGATPAAKAEVTIDFTNGSASGSGGSGSSGGGGGGGTIDEVMILLLSSTLFLRASCSGRSSRRGHWSSRTSS